MTEGFKSFMFGAHNFLIHSFLVWLAWVLHFKKIPNLWQTACIFIHDIGICDYDYLSRGKNGHWKRGAKFAYKWFGMKGFLLCAGHTHESGWPLSSLFIADKKSKLLEPIFYIRFTNWVENFGIDPVVWKETVKKNLKDKNWNEYQDHHSLFLKLRGEEKGNEFESQYARYG